MDKKTLDKILSGLTDKNVGFQDLRKLLNNFDFSVSIKNEHLIRR